MQNKIALIAIITDNPKEMLHFYRDVLNFKPQGDVNEDDPGYVEFEHEGVRFSLCTRQIMIQATGDAGYQEPLSGQGFELAFGPFDTPDEVDAAYADVIAKGGKPVTPPTNMPWGMRAAFFADPDGHIHEFFASLPK